MLLNLNEIRDYYTEIVPFIRNGIIIDTSVILEIVAGVVQTRISRKESPELEKILRFLERLKISDRWDRFYITPHILTEVCTHLRNDYEKPWRNSYGQIVEKVIPILKEMKEIIDIKKNDIIEYIDLKHPVVEVGDISIFLATDEFTRRKEKIAILAKDRQLNNNYLDNPYVMVMDYQSVMLNAL